MVRNFRSVESVEHVAGHAAVDNATGRKTDSGKAAKPLATSLSRLVHRFESGRERQ